MQTDVLIVGAGSAGSILAERLSSDTGRTVTVLEAGPQAVPPHAGDAHLVPIGPGSPVVSRYPAVLTDAPRREVDLVRGAVVGAAPADLGIAAITDAVIGAYDPDLDVGERFKGLVNDVRVYDRALTAKEIGDLAAGAP